MAVLDEILAVNAKVAGKLEPSEHDFKASRRLCVVTCIDPRLTRFFSAALGIDRGDATIVRVPGPAVGPGGDVVRAVATAVFVNNCAEVLVLAHTDCGLVRCDAGAISSAMNQRGVDRSALPSDTRSFFNLAASPRQIAVDTASAIRSAPFLPRDVLVHAGVIDIDSGQIEILVRGENARADPKVQSTSAFARPAGLPSLSAPSSNLPSLGGSAGSATNPSFRGLPAGLGVGPSAAGPSGSLFSDLPAGLGIGAAAHGSIGTIPMAPISPVGFDLPRTTLGPSGISLTPTMQLGTSTVLQPVDASVPVDLDSIAPDVPRPPPPPPEAMQPRSAQAPRPPPRKGAPAPQPSQRARSAGPQQSQRVNVSPQVKSNLDKVNAFYRAEMRPESRQAALVELDEAYQQGSANAELIRVVFKPILESGPKRYKVIDELLAIKEAASAMQRSECYVALRQMLT